MRLFVPHSERVCVSGFWHESAVCFVSDDPARDAKA